MLLAEALAERAEIQTRLEELKRRATQSARIQEGDRAPEDPTVLVRECERLFGRLEALMARINATNAATRFDARHSITDAIAARDIAGRRAKFYADLADAATARQDRYTRTEVKFIPTIDIKATRAAADATAKQYRELDTRLQQLNWTTELIEKQ